MPCWYYEKDDLLNTPSSRDGIDASTEARYRKEGARFIIDAGTSQGLYPYQINQFFFSWCNVCKLNICDPLHRNEICIAGYQVFNGLSNDTKIMFVSNSIPKL